MRGLSAACRRRKASPSELGTFLPEGSGKPYGLPGPAPTGGVLSLAPEKVPKERVQGENPLDTPRSVGVRSSLSGVRDPRLRRFPRRPPASCVLMLGCLRPRLRAWNGKALWCGAPLEAQTRRIEHPHQAPIGVVEVRQVWSARGRGPPWVGYVSMTDAGNRTLHRFYAPVNRGGLGGKPCVRGTPSVPKLSRGCAPKRVFAYFLRVQKVGRPSGRNRNAPVGAGPGLQLNAKKESP